MRSFNRCMGVGLLAMSLVAGGVMAQETTPDPMMGDTGMMGALSQVRIAYVVQDGPEVDVYVRPSMMGMSDMSMSPDMMMTDEAGMMMTPEMDMMATDEAMMGMEGMSDLGFLINTLTPNVVTDFIAAPTGSYEVTITATGDTAPVVGPLPVELLGGEYLTVVVIGSVADNTVEIVLLNEDLAGYAAGGAAVTVVNAVPASPSVTVQTDDGIVLVPDLGFVGDDLAAGTIDGTEEPMMDATMDPAMSGDTAMGAQVPVSSQSPATVFVPAEFLGTYNIRIVNPADGAELAAFDGVTVAADTAYLIVAYSPDGVGVQIATGEANIMELGSMDMMEMAATPGA